jgi:protein-tyrosine kinase
MSRIHDALTRAQQQRTSDLVQPAQTATAEKGEVRPRSPGLSFAADIESVDSGELLANCAQASWKLDPAKMLFATDNHGSSYGREQFRTLRSRLFQVRHSVPLKSILVASALPKEGRSYVAANLAQTLEQQQGSRVALIDADLRSPSLHHYLSTEFTPGISEYLRGQASESDVIQHSNVEGLWFVPAGQAGDNPVELLGSPRLRQFFDRLSACFDWIIVDSSPAIPVSDATLLARLCNAVILVVASGVTPQEMAGKTRAMFEDRTVLGVVLNCTDGRLEQPAVGAGVGQNRERVTSVG